VNEWSERWGDLLDDAPGDIPRRSRRGQSLLRAARVTDVRVTPGRLSGSVQGSRSTPYVVDIALPQLPDAAWQRIAEAIAGQVRHSARLLAGQAPDGLAVELQAAGVRLFPELYELEVSCACGEGLCRHAAGVWHAAGEAMAGDPFVLLTLRGRGRQLLLEEVSALRGGGRDAPDWGIDPAQADTRGWWESRAPLADIGLPAARSTVPALRALGDPPGWAGGVSAEALFGPLVRRGAEWARELLRAAGDQPA
jgi:uncharacterized Zn finger protein